MMRNQYRILELGSILILAAVSGCVSTTGVETPDFVYPDSSFQAVVTVEIDENGEGYGCLCVLVPIGWEADSVTHTGPISGNMFNTLWVAEYIESQYPSALWDHWIGFKSEHIIEGSAGDIYEITVRIYTDYIIGSVNTAFLGVVYYLESGWNYGWNGDPCSTTVEVVELNFDQATWGSIKSQF